MTADAAYVWCEVLWLMIGAGLVIYAVTGGADLGAGLWSLCASGPRKLEQRKAVEKAIAPIWEANHVWLIFVIVLMFSGFSRAFAALGIALHVPIGLALVGIVFRGSAYTFRAYGIQGESARVGWERVFAWASVATPFFLGLVVAAVSSGRIRVSGSRVTTGFFAGWTSAFAVSVGVFSVALFALLAAAYLAAETSGALSDDFRRRAVVMEAASFVLALGTLGLCRRDAPILFAKLVESPFTPWVHGATALCAIAALVLLLRRRTRLARYAVALQVALIVIGWGAAMRGYVILPDLGLLAATSNPGVIPALVIACAIGSALLFPALLYLFGVFKRRTD